ncbi:MAG: SAM-dependent methyltransferase [Chitinivibrionales bacterium]|nr:SAM-dependent methyltransferase [Chitinivibrionales bacterium]
MLAVHAGFWLGILSRKTLHRVDEFYYNSHRGYHTEPYNLKGLFEWEKACITGFFGTAKNLLVAGAGGGREAVALLKSGYTVDGFECHPELTQFANSLLKKKGYPPTIALSERDKCPYSGRRYDGIIIGWGVYMLIQGRANRTAFLKQLRSCLKDNSPILLSFLFRTKDALHFAVAKNTANTLRFILCNEPVEYGDYLHANFVHYSSEHEIRNELRDGGFTCAHFSGGPYGYAVGISA